MGTMQPSRFGLLLRRYRLAAGLTQEELAARANLSVRGISSLERGVRRLPYQHTLQQLAAALDLSADDRAHLLEAGRRITAAAPGENGSVLRRWAASVPSLVNRAAELAAVDRHLDGMGPPVLLAAGEPGIGKSRLLQAAAERAPFYGLTVLQGGCRRHSGQEPYAPFPDVLAQCLAQLPADHKRSALEGCGWLVRLLPELSEMTGTPAVGLLPPEQERRLVFAAVARFLANTAGDAGAVLVLDDLQWSGAGSLDLLASLAESPAQIPIRVVGAYRDTEVTIDHPLARLLAELGERELAHEISLQPLDREAAAAVLRAVLPEQVDEATGRTILERAGGVPFFLVSYAHAVDLAGRHVPWNVVQSIRQRVAALSNDAQQVLQAAAVAGRVVARSIPVGMLDLPRARVLLGLDEACRARLLIETGREYRFAHDVVREVIEADTGEGWRTILYQRVAQVLEGLPERERHSRAAEIAWQFAQGDDPRRALPWTILAADRAFAVFAYDEAERQYRLAVSQAEEAGEAVREAEALWKLGRVLRFVARYGEALEALERAIVIYNAVGSPDGEAETVHEIGLAHLERGALEIGLARVSAALESLDGRASAEGLSSLYHDLTALLLLTHRFGELSTTAQRWLELVQGLGDERVLAAATRMHGTALQAVGRIGDALDRFESALTLAETSKDVEAIHHAAIDLGTALVPIGALKPALVLWRRALEIAEQIGAPGAIARTLKGVAEVLIFLGDWPQAQTVLQRALPLATPGESLFAMSPLRVLGFLCICRGDWEEASQHLNASLELATSSQRPYAIQAAQGFLAMLDLREGRADSALTRVQPLLANLESEYEDNDLAIFLPVAPEAYLALGDVSAAQNLTERIMARNRSRRQHLALVHALRVKGMVLAGQDCWPAAEKAFGESISMAQAMCYPYAEALAHWQHGLALARAGGEGIVRKRSSHKARTQLEHALAAFRDLGAQKDVERTEQAMAMHPN